MIPSWLKGSLLLAATLAAGICLGVWYERLHGGMEHGGAGDVGMIAVPQEHIVDMLGHSLQLDSTQRRAIIATLHRHQLHVDSAWGTLRPHVRATLDSTHAEIMGMLRPEQREAFRKLTTELHGRRHH